VRLRVDLSRQVILSAARLADDEHRDVVAATLVQTSTTSSIAGPS